MGDPPPGYNALREFVRSQHAGVLLEKSLRFRCKECGKVGTASVEGDIDTLNDRISDQELIEKGGWRVEGPSRHAVVGVWCPQCKEVRSKRTTLNSILNGSTSLLPRSREPWKVNGLVTFLKSEGKLGSRLRERLNMKERNDEHS